jgi:hypothetical protein
VPRAGAGGLCCGSCSTLSAAAGVHNSCSPASGGSRVGFLVPSWARPSSTGACLHCGAACLAPATACGWRWQVFRTASHKSCWSFVTERVHAKTTHHQKARTQPGQKARTQPGQTRQPGQSRVTNQHPTATQPRHTERGSPSRERFLPREVLGFVWGLSHLFFLDRKGTVPCATVPCATSELNSPCQGPPPRSQAQVPLSALRVARVLPAKVSGRCRAR